MSLNQNPYKSSIESGADSEATPWLVRSGVGLASIANIGAMLAWLPLLEVAVGSKVRPMMESAISILFVAIGLLVAAPVCILAVRRHREHCLSAYIGLVFSLLPFPLSSVMLQLIVSFRGLTMLE